ncbi:hypothetical protein SUGI_0591510 [Cryptomeria japonica]|uniref:uncharacterized protein LOC131050120 n=1 Tax=Cryptomeria japonica TaxID=3369 RepID=UPI0024149A46|nr:uncharacterized protein LOC131050120 [Cryptomeria japonica]GLJ29922.1 hypothetical protein SUGI_0591510 [Cryptomeria japonica]
MSLELTVISPASNSNGSARDQLVERVPSICNNDVPAWWESIASARSAIQTLISILGHSKSLDALLDSEHPGKDLLDSRDVARSISARLHNLNSGSASDALCQWFYDTFQSSNQDLHLVVLRYVPLIAGLYLSRLFNQAKAGIQQQHQQHLSGFEAVLLTLYMAEVKVRGGRPVVITVPDLNQPSLYHEPRYPCREGSQCGTVGQLYAPLEPQVAVMSMKRASIVGVTLELFYQKIAVMPAAAKIEACEFVQGWAGQNCTCVYKLDRADDVSQSNGECRTLTQLGTDDVAYDGSNSSIDDVAKLNIDDVTYDGNNNLRFDSVAYRSRGTLGGVAPPSSSLVIDRGRTTISGGDVAYESSRESEIDDVTKLSTSDVAYSKGSQPLNGGAEFDRGNKSQIDDVTEGSTRDISYTNGSMALSRNPAASSSLVIGKGRRTFDADDMAYNISNKSQIDDGTYLSTGDSKSLGGATTAASSSLVIYEGRLGRARGERIPLPWELLQPILRILGHCLMSPVNTPEVRDAASVATRILFARVSHDLVPEAILATRSLIKLDIAARERANFVAKSAANTAAATSTAAAGKPKKPEVHLVLK